MKIKRQKSSKKLWIALSVVFLIIIGSSIAYALTRTQQSNPSLDGSQSTSDDSTDLSPSTGDQQQSGQDQKEQSLNNEQNPTTPSNSLTVTITAVNQTTDVLQIRSLIGSVLSTGTCTLALIKGDVVISKSTGIQAGPSNSTCTGFDIPVGELSSGIWTIKLSVTSGSSTGSVTQNIEIE